MTSRADVMYQAYRVQHAAQRAFAREFGYAIWGGDPSFPAVLQADEAGYGSVPAYIDSLTEHIPAQFERFLERDPATLDGMAESLESMAWSIDRSVVEGTKDLQGEIENWRGTAARNFRGQFLTRFGSFRDKQIGLANDLALALRVMQAALERSRSDVIMIADDTVEALEALDFSGRDSSGLILTVVSGVITVVSAAPTGPAGVTLALAGAVTMVVKEYEDYRAQEINGVDTGEVLGSMSSALRSVNYLLSKVEEGVLEGLREDWEQVDSELHEFSAPRPRLADIEDLDDFQPDF